MDTSIDLLVNCESTAYWRRCKQEEFPTDFRNGHAAEILTKLHEQICQLEGSDIAQKIERLCETTESCREVISEELRGVGFWWEPETAEELLTHIARSLQSAYESQKELEDFQLEEDSL